MKEIATAFLYNNEEIMLVKRAPQDTYAGRWAAVSGGLEIGEHDPLDTAIREIREETGLAAEELELIERGEAYIIHDPEYQKSFCAYPFLFAISDEARKSIQLNEENVELIWIRPEDLDDYDTVLDLYKAVEKCFSSDLVRT